MISEMKRSNDEAFSMHLEVCSRTVMKSAYKYPWELSILESGRSKLEVPRPVGPFPLMPVIRKAVEDGSAGSSEVQEIACKKLLCRKPLVQWDKDLFSQRDVAI